MGDLRGRARAWPDRPAAPAAAAVALAVAFILERLVVVAHGDLARFVMAERRYANPSQVPKGLPILPNNGYDGQFFYRLALNPTNLHHSAYGITFDSNFRAQRIGYPLLAWLVSFGQHALVPLALVVVNIAALAVIAWVGGAFAVEAGHQRLWGLLLVGYFGFAFSLGRDLAEPVAAACLLAGMLAYRRKHPLAAAALLAYGALTRETVMVAVGAIALVRIVAIARRRATPGAEDLAWLVPGAVFAAWQAVVYDVTGKLALTADTSSNTGFPGKAMVHALVTNLGHLSLHAAAVDAWVVEFVVLVTIIVLAAGEARTSGAPAQEKLAFGLFIVELFVLSPSIWNGVADLRSLDEVYLFAVLVLLGGKRRLTTLALVLAPGLAVVLAHRAVSL